MTDAMDELVQVAVILRLRSGIAARVYFEAAELAALLADPARGSFVRELIAQTAPELGRMRPPPLAPVDGRGRHARAAACAVLDGLPGAAGVVLVLFWPDGATVTGEARADDVMADMVERAPLTVERWAAAARGT